MRRPETGTAAFDSATAGKRIDEIAGTSELGNRCQKMIRQESNIGAHLPDRLGKHEPVAHAGRMICGDDEGANRWNRLPVDVVDTQADIQGP
jgi:hypothetical protein